MISWAISIGASTIALVLAAAGKATDIRLGYAHLAIAAAVAIYFALLAIRSNRELSAAGTAPALVASNSAKYMGYVWAWAAINLGVTYGTGVLVWREWLVFTVVSLVIGALCVFFSVTLKKDVEEGRSDDTMLKVGRTLAIIQLVGMVIAMVGLLIDGKMTRFLNPKYTDWAASNIFFFGAMAIAAISGDDLRARRFATRATGNT